jgi:ActR/RegA family two-component response regulator
MIVQPPSVVIAANPYEAELCRRALVETGLQVLIADGGEGALDRVREVEPLVLVVALGIFHCDPLELVVQARAQHPALPIFLLADREGEVPDEEKAAQLGATRLFLRPIDIDALADAIEKRAVEAEIHDELSEAIQEFSVRPPTIDAAPLVEESIVEMEADYEESAGQPVARIALRRVPREPTQVLTGGGGEPPPIELSREVTDLPRERAESLFERTEGLFERMDLPRERTESLFERTEGLFAPTEGLFAPTELPRERTESLFERTELPRERTESLFERMDLPRQVTDLPRHATELTREPAACEADAGEALRADELAARSVRMMTADEPPSLHVELAPVTASAPEPLLRADEALAGVGLQALVGTPDFVHRAAGERAPRSTERPRPVDASARSSVNLRPAATRSVVAARTAGARADRVGADAVADGGGQGAEVGAEADAPARVGVDGAPGADERSRAEFDEPGSFARRLESELSAAERRLFPDSPSTASARADEYEDALGDIDLDALGIDTIPGIGGDGLDPGLDLRPRNGHVEPAAPPVPEGRPSGRTEPYAARVDAAPARADERAERRTPRPSLPDAEGDLAVADVAQVLAQLHAAGFSGALTFSRGDGDKTLFFDDGQPVGARSSFAHDRLADLLLREGAISREAHQRLRELPDGGRRAALQLVERGLVKSSELFATLRHHVEEIFYACFAWERGSYRLGREQPAPEDRVRMGSPPLALILEGVRRKYGLERLAERVGPPETVLTPTTALMRVLDECALTSAERVVAELIDGERTLAELTLGAVGTPLPEAAVYAVAWVLVAVGAVRVDGEEPSAEAGVRAAPTLVTAGAASERRTRPRPVERARDRDADRAIDRERVRAKRAQVQDGDYFAVLGLQRDASAHEVARAFERLKREFAPERFAEPVRQELADALREIGEILDEAHRVLADDAVRRSYRDSLATA